ncbi:histidine kinase [Frankia sp. CN7]|uniref:sensor histidine kinase n=1 Tax=Frankia nepalensis TaxID=1836974 RepID=UPI001933D1CA|nr:histidine kinase [Frankia nepalensis]MBL7496225.1 histidine kinase [Frankia nepalensis]
MTTTVDRAAVSSGRLVARWAGGARRAARAGRAPVEAPDVPGVIFGRMRHGAIGRMLRARPVLVDSALTGALAMVVLPPSLTVPRPLVVVVPFTLAALAPLCLRRRFPVTAFVAVTAIGFTQLALRVPTFGMTGALVAFYTVAVWRPRPVTAVAASALIAWICWLCAIVPSARLYDRVAVAIFLGAFVVTAGVLGVNVNTRRAYLASVADRAARLERERDQQARLAAAGERARIAREMHDIVAHNLSVMIALADGATFALRDPAPGEPPPAGSPPTGSPPTGSAGPAAQAERVALAARAVESISATGREALTQMRGLLGVLRDDRPDAASPATAAGTPGAVPAPAAARGGAMAPQPRLDELAQLVEQVRRAGLPVTLVVEGERRELTADVELTVFRIVQESLTNVLKHAGSGARAAVALRYAPGRIDVRITDSGGAGRPAVTASRDGRGINGMRERAALHGGTLTAGPDPGLGGWRVNASIGAASAAAPRPRADAASSPPAATARPVGEGSADWVPANGTPAEGSPANGAPAKVPAPEEGA